MKKYTIKDKSGTKKTIFAKDLAHALTFVDSKAKDEAKSLSDALSKHNNNIKDAYVEEWWGQTDESPKAVARRYNLQLTIRARRGDETLYRFTGSNANIERAMDDGYFYSVENEAGKYVKDFITKDEANHPKTFKFFINNRAVSEDEYTKSFIKEAAREHQSARTAQRVINEDKESAKVSGKNTFISELGRKFSIIYDSKVKDEANLPTTLQALVNDEEAAIKAYEVAIKNLEGKIDETQIQVLINIMKDERRHVENLYAILNGQVTEKNLEDSIKDSLDDYRNAVKEAVDALNKINGKYNEQDEDVVKNALKVAKSAIARAEYNWKKWYY